jgi:hypothetical protein
MNDGVKNRRKAAEIQELAADYQLPVFMIVA